jgi:hypothetical protein
MLVPVWEFRRLRKHVEEELAPRHEGIPGAYFTLFGAAIATGVAIPPLLTASGLPDWIIPTFIVSASAFLLLGVALVLLSRTLSAGKKKNASEIVQDMRTIEATYIGGKADAPSIQSGSDSTD